MNETHHLPASSDQAVLFISTARGVEPPSAAIAEQRQAGQGIAAEHGLSIVREFIEFGAPATSPHQRPALQRMLNYLAAHPTVGFAILPGLHRFARTIDHFRDLQQRFRNLSVRIMLPSGEYSEPGSDAVVCLAAAFEESATTDDRRAGRGRRHHSARRMASAAAAAGTGETDR
ncbi:recombinase family protein [Nocardia mexicana]|uniref:recombinase family protein n=1 Tax=Nocardia mexicana TaxID=279262 RepID=UPI0008362414|nr:recombinase family protein [Nocardia mexicana]